MDELIAITTVATVIIIHEISNKTRNPRRWGSSNLFKSISRHGSQDLLCILKCQQATGQFHNFLRMTPTNFENLLNLVGPKIAKRDNQFQMAIPVQQRLAVTLRFLASGDSFTSLQYTFKMSKQIISKIVPEVCSALCTELKDYVTLPKTPDAWLEISKTYEETSNFPHCVGAIDGKHIVLQAPINSGSEFYNYKSFYSIVLLAAVDANYNFLFADIGCQGRISDGGVFKDSKLWIMIENGTLKLPPAKPFPNRKTSVPYFFVADSAFALHENVMKPYSGNYETGTKERIFNYRLSRARRIVENVFGIVSGVFRVLRKPIQLEPIKAELVVMTIVYPHNYLRVNNTGNYNAHTLDDMKENNTLTSFLPIRPIPRRSAATVKKIRDEIADYCINEGKVEWQENYS